MSRALRVWVFAVAAALLSALLVVAITGMPRFGTHHHPYGSRAVHTATRQQQTTNTVTSVNFDQRAIDTMGEELMLFAAAVGVLVLLRETREEVADEDADELREEMRRTGRELASTSLLIYVMLVVTTLVGLYIVAHGAISPGGGFQGGVILATGVHLLFVGGGYFSLERARPVTVYEIAESLAAASFVVLGLAGTALTGALLTNVLPLGALNDLLSGGTTEILNAIVGVEVTGAFTAVLGRFIEQYVVIRAKGLAT
jgi:multicomponent Na+:H+ antiporter subunit B